MIATKPYYTKETNDAVFQQLRADVKALVDKLAPKRKKIITAKAFLFPLLYILTYAASLISGNNTLVFYSCYFLLGILLVAIFLNTVHDAVHGTIFENKKWNEWYVYFFDVMGANSFIWKARHIRFHHNYPNVDGWDTDIEQSSLFRVFPTGPFSAMHRYQHIYLPFLYPFYLPNWLLVRDFKDFFNKKKPVRKLIHIPTSEYVKLFLFKAFFILYTLVLPLLFLQLKWTQVLTGFLIMLFTASIFSLAVLLSPHANTESAFPVPDNNNQLPHSWMMHMLKTTNDVTHNNWFTRFFMGCFNFHVAHHLFPNVNHMYYPEITRLIINYAARHNLPYRQFTLVTSLKHHYKLLKQNAVTEDIFEETM